MNKKIIVVVGVCFMLFVTTLVSAKGPAQGLAIGLAKGLAKGPMGPAEHLYLYEKTPVEGHAWTICEHCSWGKMIILFNKLFFVFNGHNLVNDTDYTLISYNEPGTTWPATDCVILGTGTADADGNVHIMGLMPPLVYNSYTDPDETPASDEYSGIGAKIWLVLSSDMDGTILQGWNPADYLFEGKLLT
jgi:hypothetical protein